MSRKEFAATLAISVMLYSALYAAVAIWLHGGTGDIDSGQRAGFVFGWFLAVPVPAVFTSAFVQWVFSE